MSNCPYSHDQLDYWDGVTNPMGASCYICDDFECEHNSNIDENPEYLNLEDKYDTI